MEDNSDALSGAEEYVAAEIELAEPLTPEQEKDLREALENLDTRTFASCDIDPRKISLLYDPTRTSKADLLRRIEAAGGRPSRVESEESPLL